MLPRLLYKILALLVFKLFTFSSVIAQSEFHDDSLKIVENANKILAVEIDIENQEEIIDFLGQGVVRQNDLAKDLIQFYLARFYYLKQQLPKAIIVANRNIEDNYNPNDSDAKFFNIKGAIHSLKREYNLAIQSFLKAAKGYQNQGNELREHVIYNNIANIYLALGDHKQAYHYSKLCFSVYGQYPMKPNFLSFLGILIVCENNLDMLDSAKAHIDLGMKYVDTTKDIQGKILMNFVKSEWEYKNKEFHKAIPFAIKSLRLSEQYQLKQFVIMSEILLMNIHNELKEYRLALDFGLSAKNNQKYYSNISMQHSITSGLSVAYAGIGEYEEAYLFIKETDSLKSIDRSEKNKRSMDSLLVQFESLTHKNKILGQEAVIAIQNHTIERRNNTLIIIGFTLLLLFLFIISFFIYNRQRLKLIKNQQDVEIANAITASEEAERNRLSSELHDGLAAELTALKLELEQHNSISERVFFMLNKAHQITRRISHNLSPFVINKKSLVDALAYLVGNNNVNGNLSFYSNVSNDLNLKPKVKTLLYRSTQELLQNALKHSNATEIVVQVILNKDMLTISVEDNGVGMEEHLIHNSVGLGSLMNRIQLINGSFDIDSSPNRGTTIFINYKIEK